MGRSLELHRTPVDLVELAERVLGEHRQLAHKHTLRLISDEDHPRGYWDLTRIGRAIDVRSEAGVGSTFSVRLPLASESEA